MSAIESIRLSRTNDLIAEIGAADSLRQSLTLTHANGLIANIAEVAIPDSFKKTAQIRRLITIYGSSGNVIDETYQRVVDDHKICFWPLSGEAIYASEKLGFKITHEIHPLSDISGWQIGDFYVFDGASYQIIVADDQAVACHFKVLEVA